MDKNCFAKSFFILFIFHRRIKAMQVWNDMRVSDDDRIIIFK